MTDTTAVDRLENLRDRLRRSYDTDPKKRMMVFGEDPQLLDELLSQLRQQGSPTDPVLVPVEPFQARVHPWMMACFGEEIAGDKLERGDRHLEEVLELLQSGDYPAERVLAIRDYVYGRPKGEPSQEVGGVMVTLAAYCLAHGLDMHAAAEAELARIWTKVDQIRAKQATKPVGSALPVAAPTSSSARGVGPEKQIETVKRAIAQWPSGPHNEKTLPEAIVDALAALVTRPAGGEEERPPLLWGSLQPALDPEFSPAIRYYVIDRDELRRVCDTAPASPLGEGVVEALIEAKTQIEHMQMLYDADDNAAANTTLEVIADALARVEGDLGKGGNGSAGASGSGEGVSPPAAQHSDGEGPPDGFVAIDTAPKDGTKFPAWPAFLSEDGPPEVVEAYWYKHLSVQGWITDALDCGDYKFEPTHWRPAKSSEGPPNIPSEASAGNQATDGPNSSPNPTPVEIKR